MGLAFERAGSGPPLVLLHGVGHRRQAWQAVMSRLAPSRDVIAVDLPGHGDSPPLRTGGRPPLAVLLGEVTGLLDELGLDRPSVAGNSLGGRLALDLAVAGRASSVTALAPAGFWRRDSDLSYGRAIFKLMELAGSRTQRLIPLLTSRTAGRAVVFAMIVNRPSQMSPQQAADDVQGFVAARDAVEMILADLPRFTGGVPSDVPVTIGWGTSDRLLPFRHSAQAQAVIPHARLARLPGCGHVPMTDDPELVARVLLRGSAAVPEAGAVAS